MNWFKSIELGLTNPIKYLAILAKTHFKLQFNAFISLPDFCGYQQAHCRIIKCLGTRHFLLNLFPKSSHSFGHPLDSPIDSELTNHWMFLFIFFLHFCWGLCSHLSLALFWKDWQIVGCQRQSQIGVKIPTFPYITFSLWY